MEPDDESSQAREAKETQSLGAGPMSSGCSSPVTNQIPRKPGGIWRGSARSIFKGRYKIDVVDVLKDAGAAYKNGVLVTPTLILLKPLPKVTVLGNLNDTGQVLAALRLTGDER